MTTLRINRRSMFSGLRQCSFFLCVLPWLLTGCVANWSVLGERIPGGTHPPEVACSTCAAPQGVVANAVPVPTPVTPPGTAGTQTNATVDQTNKSVTPAPGPVPEVPVVSDSEKLRNCEQNLTLILEQLEAMKDRDQQQTAAYALLLQQMGKLKNEMKTREDEEAQRYADLNQILNEFGSLRNNTVPENGPPQPLQTVPAPQAPEAVNELKVLPPVNGTL